MSRLSIAVCCMNQVFALFYDEVFDLLGVDNEFSSTGTIPCCFVKRCNEQKLNDVTRNEQPGYKRKIKFWDKAKILE